MRLQLQQATEAALSILGYNMCAMYGKLEYWNNRYKKNPNSNPCEWYRSYLQFCHLLHSNILGAAASTNSNTQAPMSTITTNPSTSVVNGTNTVFSSLSPSISDGVPSLATSPPHNIFPKNSETRVLIAGCGNSLLPFDMIRNGWTGGIVGVDFSPIVVQQMHDNVLSSKIVSDAAAEGSKQPKDILEYICADVTQPLPGYADGSFDLILVKGTFDAILCSDSSRANVLKFVEHCVRLLSSNHGVLFIISTGSPDNRLEYLEHQNELSYYWRNVSVHPLRNSNHTVGSCQPSTVYCYICRKRSETIINAMNETKIIPTGKEN